MRFGATNTPDDSTHNWKGSLPCPHLFDTCLHRNQLHRDKLCCLWFLGRNLVHTMCFHIELFKKVIMHHDLDQERKHYSSAALHTFIANWEFLVGTFLVVPLSSVWPVVDVDLHAKFVDVDVVRLLCGPGMIANPRAVVSNPFPSFIQVVFGDSNPVIWAACPVWQQGDHVVILFLVLESHHV